MKLINTNNIINRKFKREFLFFLIFLVFLFIFPSPIFSNVSAEADDINVNVDYNIIVKENGDSLVVVTINGSGVVNIPLPLDATPVVKGAVYIPAENGIDIQVGELPVAVAYKTSLYTAKREEWIFNAKLSNKTKTAIVNMPQNVEVLNTEPKAGISTGKTLQIKFPQAADVSINYRFSDEKGKYYDIYQILFFILLIIAVVLTIILIVGRKKKSKKTTETREIKVTKDERDERERDEKKESGQHHIIKTLTRNEGIVVKALQESNGEMKRNELERKTQLSKSSLAAALNTLERKNIIKIDKTQTIHYVEFTEWFKRL